MTAPIEESLIELLRPTIVRLVREEVKRAKLEWRWAPVPRAAELLGISEEAVRQRVQRGQLPGKRIERRVYVDMQAVDRLLVTA